MKVQRLGWAGAKITTAGLTILIDAVEDFGKGKFFEIDTPDATYRFSHEVKAYYILLTHLHYDHYDKEVMKKVLKPGGKVLVSSMIADTLIADGVNNVLPL